MLLSKATYKWGHYRSNQNQQKSNNMQALWQVSVSLTQDTYQVCFLFLIRKQVDRIKKSGRIDTKKTTKYKQRQLGKTELE